MEKKEILGILQSIIAEVVDDEDVIIDENTVASDVEGWDSLAHVLIAGEIRNKFGVKLTSTEFADLRNVGEMIDVIAEKL